MLERKVKEGTIRIGRSNINHRFFYIYEFIDNKGKVWRYADDCDKYDKELLNAGEMIIVGYDSILSKEKQTEYLKYYIETVLANGDKCTRSYWG